MSDKPGIEHLRVGDTVWLIWRHRNTSSRKLARITSQKRVWWEFEELEQRFPMTHRLRADSQDAGNQFGVRFATNEQLVYEGRRGLAQDYLKSIEIEFHRSPFGRDPITLANLLRPHFGLEEI